MRFFISSHSFIILVFDVLSIISLFSTFVNNTSINDNIIFFNLFLEMIIHIRTKISLLLILSSFILYPQVEFHFFLVFHYFLAYFLFLLF